MVKDSKATKKENGSHRFDVYVSRVINNKCYPVISVTFKVKYLFMIKTRKGQIISTVIFSFWVKDMRFSFHVKMIFLCQFRLFNLVENSFLNGKVTGILSPNQIIKRFWP